MKDKVIKAIKATISQGRKSLDSSGDCAYRAYCGDKCIVGHMITDDAYSCHMEQLVPSLGNLVGVALDITDSKELDFLRALQNCHDNAADYDFVNDFTQAITLRVRAKELPEYCLEGLSV